MNKNVKSVIGGVLILIGLISIFKGSFLGGLLIGLVGTSIIPVISEKYKEKYPFWRKKVLRRGVLSGVLLLGFVIMLSQTKSNTSYSKEKMLVHYIKNDTLDKSLKNIRELGDIGRLFENSNYAMASPSGYIIQKYDSVNEVTSLTFNPKFDYSNENDNTSFLKEDNEKGKLKDYIIKFKVDKKDSIISKQTFITYSNGATEEFANNDVPNFQTFIDEKAVKEQEKIYAKEQQKEKEIYEMNKIMGDDDFWADFPAVVKQRIYKLVLAKNCRGLQEEFNFTADNLERVNKRGISSTKHLDLMDFLDKKMKEFDCYE